MTFVMDQRSVMVGTDDSDSDNSLSFRQSVKGSLLSAGSGTQCQLTLLWGLSTSISTQTTSINLAYFGQGSEPGGTTGPTFTGNQVQVKFGGGATTGYLKGATSTSSTISGTVLTVGGTLAGVWGPNLMLSGVGVTLGTTIISNGTGSGGAGTYNLSASSTVSVGESISGTGTVTSDVFTLGESWDSTKTYLLAFDTSATAGDLSLVASGSGGTSANTWFITTAAGTAASATSPTGSWSDAANQIELLAAISVTALPSVASAPLGILGFVENEC